MKIINLSQLKSGESGIVAEIRGGYGFIKKIESMGIRSGKKVTKVTSHFWHGPQVLEVDHFKIAVGFGMANKIFVEVEREK